MIEVSKKYLEKMILSNQWFDDKEGTIRFKYYGDFNGMDYMYEDCKDDLKYIGNSSKDGAPVFEYSYKNLSFDTLMDLENLNILLRKYKILKYKGEELRKNEKSVLTFLKFFFKFY